MTKKANKKKEEAPAPVDYLKEYHSAMHFLDKSRDFFDNMQDVVCTRIVHRKESGFRVIQNSLNVVKSVVERHQEKARIMQEKLDKGQYMVDLNNDIAIYTDFKSKLTKQIEKSLGQIEEVRKESAESSQLLSLARKKLSGVNSENVLLIADIKRAKDRKAKSLSSLAFPMISKRGQPSTEKWSIDPSIEEQGEVLLLTQRKAELGERLQSRRSRVQTLGRQFLECLGQFCEYLQSTQKKVSGSSLRGSMLFKIMSNHNLKRTQSFSSLDLSGMSQDGASRSAVYNLLKEKVGRHRRVKAERVDIQVGWPRFKQFEPLQLVGLMNLEPKSFDCIREQVRERLRQLEQLT